MSEKELLAWRDAVIGGIAYAATEWCEHGCGGPWDDRSCAGCVADYDRIANCKGIRLPDKEYTGCDAIKTGREDCPVCGYAVRRMRIKVLMHKCWSCADFTKRRVSCSAGLPLDDFRQIPRTDGSNIPTEYPEEWVMQDGRLVCMKYEEATDD